MNRIDNNSAMRQMMIQQYAKQDGEMGFSVDNKEVSEEQLNQILIDSGSSIRVLKGAFHVDGVDGPKPADPYALGVATSSTPELPDTMGGHLSSGDLADRVTYFSTSGISDGALLFMTLSTLRDKYEKAEDIAREKSTAAFAAVQAYNVLELKSAKNKIEEQKNAALERLCWSVGAAVLSAVAGGVGAKIGGGAGGALAGSAQGLGTMTNALGDYVGKAAGAEARANAAELTERRMQALKSQSENMLRSAEQEVEEMKRGKENALQLLKQHFELELQITRSITQ